MKIVCLGNEFIEGDRLAKEVGVLLSGDFDVVNVQDSFELMGVVSGGEEFVILDVVEGLDEVVWLRVEDLKVDAIASAHDFDAVYVLKLLDADVKIIGIPVEGDVGKVLEEVREKLTADFAD